MKKPSKAAFRRQRAARIVKLDYDAIRKESYTVEMRPYLTVEMIKWNIARVLEKIERGERKGPLDEDDMEDIREDVYDAINIWTKPAERELQAQVAEANGKLRG